MLFFANAKSTYQSTFQADLTGAWLGVQANVLTGLVNMFANTLEVSTYHTWVFMAVYLELVGAGALTLFLFKRSFRI